MLKNVNILYVEDDILTIEKMSMILKTFSDRLYIAKSYDEALEIFNNENIDLVITDIELSTQSGIDLIKYIRNKNDEIPIIVQTAYRSHDYLFECANLDIQAYLYKPITISKLKECFNKVYKLLEISSSQIVAITDKIDYNFKTKLLESLEGFELQLNKKEIKLIELLLRNNEKIVSYQEIEDNVWDDYNSIMTENSLRQLIKGLRKKVGKEVIKNLSGIGYKIELKN